MPATSPRPEPAASADVQATLRDVVETLAPLDRRAGSHGERQAADWLVERLRAAGSEARIEEADFLPGYAPQLLPLGLAGAAAGLVALSPLGRRRGIRALAAGIGVAAGAAIADDARNGTRLWRRLIARPQITTNVVAETGDRSASRTLVVLAHHDAAPTGVIFDQSFQRWLGDTFPELIAQTNTSLPLWWPVAGAPVAAGIGAATNARALTVLAVAWCLLNGYLGYDVARSDVVPGANDNLSAVATLVALAERFRDEPVDGLRVLLASCGAEEVLQGGIYGFAARHFPDLDTDRTWVLNLDTVGSPELIMLEGEGTFGIEEYPGPEFRDLIAEVAERIGVGLTRDCRSRSSTDSVIPSRAGYPTATIASWDDHKCLSNYHLPTDTPENLDFDTVGRAAALSEAVARALADAGAGAPAG